MFPRIKQFVALAALALVPVTAVALPQDCDVVCECDAPTSQVCAVPGGRKVITCNTWCGFYMAAPEAAQPLVSVDDLTCHE